MSASAEKRTAKGVLTARTSNEETPDNEDREGLFFDKQYEFNASRYYDFEKVTPSDVGDKWFFTDAPKALITPTDTEETTATNEGEDSRPRSTSTNMSSNPSVTTTNDNKQYALQPITQLILAQDETVDEYDNQENIAPPPPPPPPQAHTSNDDEDASACPVVSGMDLTQQLSLPVQSTMQQNSIQAILNIDRGADETLHPPVTDTNRVTIVENNSRPVTRQHVTTTTTSHTTGHATGRRRAEILVTAAPTSKQSQQHHIQPSIPLELLEAARRRGIEMAVERERQLAEEEKRQEEEWHQRQQERASDAGLGIKSIVVLPVYMKKKKDDQEDNKGGRPVTRSQSSKPPTIPKSPAFMLGRTAQCEAIKTTEQLELECIEKEKVKEAQLRQHNAVTMKTAMAPPPPQNLNRKQQYTVPDAIQLATAARQKALSIMASSSSSGRIHHPDMVMREEGVRTAVEVEAIKAFASAPFNTDMYVTSRSDYFHQNEAGRKRRRDGSGGGGTGTNLLNAQQQQHQGLTLAKSPYFATKRRARPSRFKPTEQQEFEEMEAARAMRFNNHQQNKLNNNNNCSNMTRNQYHQQQQQQQQQQPSYQEAAIVVVEAAANRDENDGAEDTGDVSTEKVGEAREPATKLRRTTLHIGKALRVPVSAIDQQVENKADQVAADMMNM